MDKCHLKLIVTEQLSDLNRTPFDFDKMGKFFSKLSFLTSVSNYCEEPSDEVIEELVSDSKENERWDSDTSSAYVKPLWTTELSLREQQELALSEAEAQEALSESEAQEALSDTEAQEVDKDNDFGLRFLFGEDEDFPELEEECDIEVSDASLIEEENSDEYLKSQVVEILC